MQEVSSFFTRFGRLIKTKGQGFWSLSNQAVSSPSLGCGFEETSPSGASGVSGRGRECSKTNQEHSPMGTGTVVQAKSQEHASKQQCTRSERNACKADERALCKHTYPDP